MKPDGLTARRGPHRIAAALAMCGIALLAGCAKEGSPRDTAAETHTLPPVGGVGGTGLAGPVGGVGGTGLAGRDSGSSARIAQNGIGGTGIVGVVTGFGSILVNGLEVTFDARTPTEVNGVPATGEALAVGKVVAVSAEGSGRTLSARRIVVVSAVEGQVQAVDLASGTMEVVGQRVHWGPSTVLGGRSGSSGTAPRPGDTVRVSGLRKSDGTLEATYVERASPSGTVQLSGPIVSRDGGLAVYGVPVEMSPGLAADAFVGQSALLSGSWDGKKLTVRAIAPHPVAGLLNGVARFSVQGYVSTQGRGTRIDVAGLVLLAQTEARTAPGVVAAYVLDQLGIVTGHFAADRSLVLERIEKQEHALPPGSGASQSQGEPMDKPTRPDRPSTILPGGAPGLSGGGPPGLSGGGPPGLYGGDHPSGGPPGCPPRCPPGKPSH